MGDTFTGSTKMDKVSNLTAGQQNLASLLEQAGPDVINQLLGMGQADMQELFQKTYVDPAMLAYSQDIIPAIQERFGGDTAASSALNQTLAKSAENLGTMLSGQMGQFAQNQQNFQASILQNLLTQAMSPQFENVMYKKPGLLDYADKFAEKGMKAYGAYMGA